MTALLSSPAAVLTGDGRLDFFATDSVGAVWHMRQNAPHGPFGPWESLGGEVRDPCAIQNQDGRIELFAIEADTGAVLNGRQSVPGSGTRR
ncbi:hypothetical protein [Streptomyces sp. NPDC093225]|uniref:hypothetical protein n=1 Tax=Streptomyces sp. NPDC093225 TaxID=3366034 RepID=UPI0038307F58